MQKILILHLIPHRETIDSAVFYSSLYLHNKIYVSNLKNSKRNNFRYKNFMNSGIWYYQWIVIFIVPWYGCYFQTASEAKFIVKRCSWTRYCIMNDVAPWSGSDLFIIVSRPPLLYIFFPPSRCFSFNNITGHCCDITPLHKRIADRLYHLNQYSKQTSKDRTVSG